MGSVANALPDVGNYRPGQLQSGQHRYDSATSAATIPQIPQMTHYVDPSSMAMANQGYYVQQPPMPQYYGSQLSPTQAQSMMPPRQTMAFYPNQMMNQPQSAYYYPQPSQYPAQAQTMSPTMIHGQFMGGNPSISDPRLVNSTSQNTGVPFPPERQNNGTVNDPNDLVGSYKTPIDVSDGRQSTVRGPPRKPKQSGKLRS